MRSTGPEAPSDATWRRRLHAAQLEARAVVRTDDVRLQPIDDGQWRVVNAALPTSNVDALLGFVDRVGGQFLVTFLSDPGSVHRFRDREAARRAFAAGPVAESRASAEHPDVAAPTAVPDWLRHPGR